MGCSLSKHNSSSREQSDYIWKQMRGHDKTWNINKGQRCRRRKRFPNKQQPEVMKLKLEHLFYWLEQLSWVSIRHKNRSNPPAAAQTQRLGPGLLLYFHPKTAACINISYSDPARCSWPDSGPFFKGLTTDYISGRSDVVKINNPTIHCVVFLIYALFSFTSWVFCINEDFIQEMCSSLWFMRTIWIITSSINQHHITIILHCVKVTQYKIIESIIQ